MRNILCSLVWLHLVVASSQALALSSHSYTIAIDAVANGGGTMSSANYNISHLTGQPLVVGPVSSAGYTVQGGFYYIHLLEELLAKRNSSLVFDSAALYAGFDGSGIWKSTNNGATWNAAATQPANQRIRGLVIHPTNRSALFAATYGGGMFKSTTSGDVWTACANTNLAGAALNAVSLAIDANARLYAGTEAGIFTSSDCASWDTVNGGLTVDPATPPVSIVIDPTVSSTLYAGLDGAGVFTSTNSGVLWTGATIQPTNLRVKALVIDPATHSTLYVGTYGGGVFKSTNSGVNWSACATQPANLNLVSLTIDATGKLYAGTEAGVFVSIDNCASWNALNSGLPL
jgi:ligand-binding sensor domain-containing protein